MACKYQNIPHICGPDCQGPTPGTVIYPNHKPTGDLQYDALMQKANKTVSHISQSGPCIYCGEIPRSGYHSICPTSADCQHAYSVVSENWTPPREPGHDAIMKISDINKMIKGTPMQNQVGGDHYQKMKITPFEYSMANELNSLEFSIVKYLRKKGDKAKRLEDLHKLIDCAQKLIEYVEADKCE